MTYLYLYLGIGLLVGIGFSINGARAYATNPPITEVVAQALDPDWQPPKRRWLPLILISSVIWPVLLLLPLLERPFEPEAPKPEFAVAGDHLLESLTVDEIEARERVVDPLGAVPDLPFGHLNTAWQDFLAECEEGVEFRRFAADWDAGWCKERREGYVEMVDGQPGRFFMTVCKTLPEE
ncbi:hypothetical protein [Halopseudomonas maritima]|uniref:hypothetical protein n=1 Tax=Halopseudomonas maritima TaxID=2918528 RepID=UPI001EEB4781|nr:hypothetical protein [Halopseudomonas maritima]UJJ31833.1 hypothetical protein HV822_01230 [Halopseudomonas maritima]